MKLNISIYESNRQILKDIVSNFVSSLGSNMFTYGLGLMLLEQTQSALSFGIEMVITPVVSLIFMIPIGNLVDKLPHKKILIISLLARILFLLLLIMTVNLFDGMLKFIPVGIFVAINAIALTLSSTAYTASVHELVNDSKVQQLGSLTSATNSFSNIFAPVLGVTVYTILGFKVFILVQISALFISLFITLTMKFHYEGFVGNDATLKHSAFKDFKKGVDYIAKRTLLKNLILIAIALNFLFSSINLGLPYIINTQLHLDNSLIGILDMFNAIGGVIAGILMSFSSSVKTMYIKIILPLFICGFYFLSLGIIFWLFQDVKFIQILGSITMFIGGLGIAVLNITIQINIQKTTPTFLLGRVTSTMSTANTIIFPVGTIIFTFIFQSISNGAIVYLMCGSMWIFMMMILTPRLIKAINIDIGDRFIKSRKM